MNSVQNLGGISSYFSQCQQKGNNDLFVHSIDLANKVQIANTDIFDSSTSLQYSVDLTIIQKFIKRMGAIHANASQAPPPPPPLEIRELTPVQKWNSSQQTQQDLIALLQSSPYLTQCSDAINVFLRSLDNRQKYQNYLITLLDYLRREQSVQRYGENDRRQLFTLYNNKLKHSFFVVQEFRESLINYDLKPCQKLEFLYEYYSLSEQLLQKAFFFNYPTIFTQFRKFIRHLIDNEILIPNEEHLYRFIIPLYKIEEIKHYFELTSQSYVKEEYNKLLEDIRTIQDMKKIYMEGVEELMNYDYADLSANLLRNTKAKGFQFQEVQMEYVLKIEFYCMFLYLFNKLSLNFQEIKHQSINEIIHYFFTNYDLEETPLLIKCFDIFEKPAKQWESYILSYIFSQHSHMSILIRLVKSNHVSFNGKNHLFRQLLDKVRRSSCEIGKYGQQLMKIGLSFEIPFQEKIKYARLIKMVQIYFIFNIASGAQPLYEIANTGWTSLKQDQIGSIQQNSLTFLKKIIANYFSQFSVKMSSIIIDDKQFTFSTIFDMLHFIKFIKKTFLNNFINNCITYQIFFKELINHQHYIDIKALMSEDRQQQFEIQAETIEMIIVDHVITLITTKKIKKIEEILKLLLNILRLYPNPNVSHYLLSHYNYLKYLEEKDIVLPQQMKENISIDNLYYLANTYPYKIQQIDFNFLFTHQSCIKAQYTDNRASFIPIVTDQYLKFKVFLCNKAYSLKKYKYGSEIIEQVIRYQPPWISTELVKILRQNSNNIEENFIAIAFNFCARGEDLQYVLNLYLSKAKNKSNSKLNILSLKSWAGLLQSQKYLILSQEIVINESLYKNLVAQLTFNEDETLKNNHYLFFHLLTIEPERSFNYAINYNMSVSFIYNFMLEGIKKSVIHSRNSTTYLIRYLYHQHRREVQKLMYISLKQYKRETLLMIVDYAEKEAVNPSFTLANLRKMVKNYVIQKIVTEEFIELYIHPSILYKFLYEETFRKKILVDLREQPMTKPNSKILKLLCEKVGIDILELSIYNLVSRVNSKETIDDECWTIAQKLIHWGDDRKTAESIVQKLSQKIQALQIFVSIFDYLRESQPIYKEIVTNYHMEIIRSLAAVEFQKNLYGIIPENFFQREVEVYPSKNRGMLSQTHRKILKESGCVENIFVLSKALYFMYGCSDEVEKIVLGEFSLQQQDSQEFQELRKKIRAEAQLN